MPTCKTILNSFSFHTIRSSDIFSLIHMNVWGPYHTPHRDGSRYFLTIVDDYSHAAWVFLMQSKAQVASHLRMFLILTKNQFGKLIQRIRTDNGREFFNHDCNSLLSSHGILHESLCIYTPQKNRVVERKHRNLLEVARALKFQGSILENYWGDCVITAAYLINRMPTRILDGKSLFELLYGKKPTLDHLRIFGCLCYATTMGPRDKMSPCARRCIFMGYPNLQKVYRVLDPSTWDFFISQDVIFPENVFLFRETTSSQEDLDAPINSHCLLDDESASPGYILIAPPEPDIHPASTDSFP